jgi:hypothetical protein
MPIDVENLQAFNDVELLKLYRWALAMNAAGQTRSIDGRTVTFPALNDLKNMIDWLEKRIAADAHAAEGGGAVLVQFGDQV